MVGAVRRAHGGILVTDRDASLHLSNSPATLRRYTKFSNYAIAGMAGAGAGLFLLGKTTRDEHKQKAGLLSGEAALDGLFVSTALKYTTGRERPTFDNFHSKFWQGEDSLPSEHATTAWAIASVISHEYPVPFTKLLAYGYARGEYQHAPAGAQYSSEVQTVLDNIYWDNYYHDLYTNRHFLMGDWVGREGSGIQAWSRYWLTAKNSIQFSYRHVKIHIKFIPNVGTINDASARVDYWIRPNVGASAFVQ